MDRTSRNLQLTLGALALLQVLHLLDSLRTDDAESFPGVLLKPQAVLGVGGAIVALVLVRRGAAVGRTVAVVVGALVGVGFAVVHGIPVASERTEPYWGDGMADALQWIGVTAVLACAAATIVFARRDVVASPAT